MDNTVRLRLVHGQLLTYVCILIFINGCSMISFSPPEKKTVKALAPSPTFQEAQQLFDTGQYEQAIALWEAIHPDDPRYLDAQLAISSARHHIKHVEEEQATTLHVSSQIDTLTVAAEELEQQGKFQDALKKYEEARVFDPQNVNLYNKIEDIHILLEDAVERHIRLGELYFAQGDYEKSKSEWEQLLLIDPANEKATQRLEDIQVLTTTSDSVFYQRGRALFNKGLIQAAQAEFEKALRVNSANASTQEYLSRIESIPFTEYPVKKGETLASIAKKYTKNAADLKILADFNGLPEKTSLKAGQIIKIPHILRFQQALDPQKKDSIIESTEAEISSPQSSRTLSASENRASPENTTQLFEQGTAAFQAGNYREAIKLFNQVYALNPDNQEAYDYFMAATARMREANSAITSDMLAEHSQQASAEISAPSSSAINVTTQPPSTAGISEQSTSEVSDAEHFIQTGLKLRESGELKKALSLFENAAQLDPENPEIAQYIETTNLELQKLITFHLNEGIKQFNQEALENAIAEWNKVLELEPSNTQASEYKKRAEQMLEALSSSTTK